MADDLTITAGVKTGGGNAPNIGADMPPSRTADALAGIQGFSKLASTLLAPIIDREKNAAFVSGVTQVMQGKTAAEVASDSPAWARTFGDNYAVQGAQMQEAASVGTRFVTNVTTRMPELRKLSQDQFSRHVAESMDDHLPSDPQAALLAKQRIVQSLPDLTNQWARANVQWQQEDALVKHTEFLQAEVQTFAASAETRRLKPGQNDDVIDEQVTGRFYSALTAPPGVKPEVHEKVVERSLLGAVGAPGGLGLYLAIRKDGAVLSQMSPEFRDRLETQAMQSLRRDTLPPAYADAGKQGFGLGWRAHINAAVTSASPGDYLTKAAAEMNKDFAALTAVPEDLHPYISPAKLEAALNSVMTKQEQNETRARNKAEAADRRMTREALAATAKALRDANKPPPIEEQVSRVMGYFAMGQGRPGVAGSYMDDDSSIKQPAKDAATHAFFQQNTLDGKQPGTPAYDQAAMAQAEWVKSMVRPGKKLDSSVVENRLIQPLLLNNWTAEGRDALAVISKMPPASRLHLFGSEGDKFVTLYNKERAAHEQLDPRTGQMVSDEKPQDTWERVKRRTALPSLNITGGADGRAMAERFGEEAGLKGPQAELYGAVVKRKYDELDHYAGADREQQAKATSGSAVYPLGKWAVINRGQVHPSTVAPGISLDLGQQGRALDRILATRNVPDNARVMRVADTSDGKAHFYVEWLVDGQMRSDEVYGSEMLQTLKPQGGQPVRTPAPPKVLGHTKPAWAQ